MVEILQKDRPVLHMKAAEIPLTEIGTERIGRIIADLKTAMHTQKDGVAIAAPQIGEAIRLFIVNGALLTEADETYSGQATDLVFINPVITRRSREKKAMEEGCLSVRWLYGRVHRSTRVSLEAYDETGKKVKRGASGLLAQIFQHETDHLDGVLFTDMADDVWQMTPEEIAELQSTP